MIRTDISDYETRKQEFLVYKDTLEKVPTDLNAKKEYYVGCYSAEDWQYIHELLMQDGTLEDNIPDHCCECCNDCKHAPKRGIYLLSDSEAENLKSHPRVRYVNINAARYPGTFMDNPDDIAEATKIYRYPSTVKHQRYNTTSGLIPSSPGSDLKNRGSWQLKRHMQKADPWVGVANTTVFDDRIQQYGDGSDVDIIVGDQDMWFGHIEFQNNLGGPTGYRGGNVLPGNGTCDLLDLILDAPYYLDPDFFNANPSKLMRRWDGTVVPTEEAAHNWWENDSTSHRSSKFVSSGNGGSATGNDDFGTISITSGYTRANSNGSNIAYQTGTGFHGTPCASQAYGRQYGWAYNANKWFLNLYGTNHNGWEVGFDLQKVFHQIKPINPTYGTRDPTISSNSWSNRLSPPSSGYYWFRPSATDGTIAGIAYTSRPEFLDNFNGGTFNIRYDENNSVIEAGEELCDSGVIFVHAAGNRNQKIVHSDHPDYNNYFASSDYTSIDDAKSTNYGYYSMYGIQYYHTVQRRGFPGQIGIVTSTTPYHYKTISVGALDRTYTDSKERRTSYSTIGESVDVFAASEGTLAASDSAYYNRYDNTYTLDGEQSVESDDKFFNGTSSACPIFVGLLATKMQYNRSWTYSNVRNWIVGLGTVSSSEFYYGTEATTADDSNWSSTAYSMQGHPGYVAWDNVTGNEPNNAFEPSVSDTTPTEGETVEITITTDASNGTYYYTTDVGAGSTISASDFDSSSLTGSFNIVSGIGTISLDLASDSTQELVRESFRVRIRTGTGTGDTVLATSEYITITDSDAPTVTFTTTPTSIDEGSTGTFEISASGLSDGANLYWDVTRPSEFDTSSGILTVSSGVGTVSVIPTADYTTEGSQTFNLRIRPQISGEVLATSNDVTINDTSLTISYSWGDYPTQISVGTTATYTINATNGAGKQIYVIRQHRNGALGADITIDNEFPTIDNNDVATFKLTAVNAHEGSEYIYLTVYDTYTGSGWTNLVLTGSNINSVANSTYSISPASGSVNEGSSLTFNVTTTNVSDNTTLYWDVTNPGDFSTSNGSFNISSNAGSFSVTPTADSTTEGEETFTATIYTDQGRSVDVATSSTVKINDTSTAPTYSISPASSTVNEGSSLTFNITTTNVSNNTTLYWDVTNSGDFGTSNGSFTISNNSGSFSVIPTADSTTEGSETFTATIYTDFRRVFDVATSSTVTINDTSTTVSEDPPAQTLDNIRFMSGSGLTFSGSVRIVMK